MTVVTRTQLSKLSSPACSPRYTMTIPALTACKVVNGSWVVEDTAKVIGGNDHDLNHYYIWLDDTDVMVLPSDKPFEPPGRALTRHLAEAEKKLDP